MFIKFNFTIIILNFNLKCIEYYDVIGINEYLFLSANMIFQRILWVLQNIYLQLRAFSPFLQGQ